MPGSDKKRERDRLRMRAKRANGGWKFDEPEDGVYLCWTDCPPQSFQIQGVRRKNGRWITSWPVVAYQVYPSPPMNRDGI